MRMWWAGERLLTVAGSSLEPGRSDPPIGGAPVKIREYWSHPVVGV
jgi:hypothetical protein